MMLITMNYYKSTKHPKFMNNKLKHRTYNDIKNQFCKLFQANSIRFGLGLLASLFLSTTPGVGQMSETLTVASLYCEYLENPQGVESHAPNFGWVLASDKRGQRQTSYQILVYDRNGTLMWDSGKVFSSESSHVKYDGRPLKSSSSYYWSVRVWDIDDRPTAYADRARFVTALMNADEWKADWIGRGPVDNLPTVGWRPRGWGDTKKDHQSTLLRKEFQLEKPIDQAVIHISGLGLSYLYLNGSKIGNLREHSPLKTLYSQQVLYRTYDITDELLRGRNGIGVMLGNGWFNTQEKYWGWRMQWWGFPKAIAQIHIQYRDGTEEIIVSDQSWKTSRGPVVNSCIFDGETYDARLEQPGWNKAGFNDTNWRNANLVPAPAGALVSQLAPPVTITDTIEPKSVREVRPGVFVFDMGQNFAGWTRIKAQGPAGTRIQIRHAENVHESGELDPRTQRNARQTNVFILKGDDSVEAYEPYFTYHGFQYVEITGYPGTPTLSDIQGRVVHSDAAIVGQFECDNDLINHIYHCAFWSQRSLMQGLPIDCPQRDERLGWGGDAPFAESSMFAFKYTHQFYAKWLRDWKVQQRQGTGRLPHVTPRPGVTGYSVWSSVYPIITWYCYLYYGDKRLLAEHYEGLRLWVHYLESISSGHIQPRDQTGDWKTLIDSPRGGPLLISTIFYYYSTKIVANVAAALGKTDEAEQYEAMAAEIAKAFNNVFLLDSPRQRFPYGENTQAENAFPLFFEIVPEKARESVIANLVDDIRNRDGHLSTGMVGSKYLLEALTKIGRFDVAYQLFTNETYPSWGYMTKGRTTMSESWCAVRGTNNHGGIGSMVISWMFKTLAGINPDPEYPGFQRVLIKPYFPTDLNRVEASTRTIRGPVESSWKKEDWMVTLRISIPANMTGLVYLPVASADEVKEGSVKALKSPGVRHYAQDESGIILEVQSGQYEFLFEPFTDVDNTPPVVFIEEAVSRITMPENKVTLEGNIQKKGRYAVLWTVEDMPAGAVMPVIEDASKELTHATFESIGNYTLRLTATDAGRLTGYADKVVKVRPPGFDGLEAHITFNDSTPNSQLANGLTYSGTLSGGASFVSDPDNPGFGYSLKLDGSGFVTYDRYLGSDPQMTVTYWIKPTALGRTGALLLDKFPDDASGLGWFSRVRMGPDWNLSGFIGSQFRGAGRDLRYPLALALTPDKWVHVALSFGDGTMRGYINGLLVGSIENVPYSPANLDVPLVIGYRQSNNSSFFTGLIDEIRIYDHALDCEQINDIYKNDVSRVGALE